MGAPHERRFRASRRPALACAGALVLVLGLMGCGGNSASSTPSQVPAGSVTGRDGGFTTVIPSGFTNGLAALSGGPITLQYAALAPKANGFRSNINVVRESAHGLSDAGTVAEHELVGLKAVAPQAHGFSTIRKLTLDGAPARGVDYLNQPRGGPVLHQYQVFALHSDQVYTVTYTALRSDYRATLPGMERVLAAWRWK